MKKVAYGVGDYAKENILRAGGSGLGGAIGAGAGSLLGSGVGVALGNPAAGRAIGGFGGQLAGGMLGANAGQSLSGVEGAPKGVGSMLMDDFRALPETAGYGALGAGGGAAVGGVLGLLASALTKNPGLGGIGALAGGALGGTAGGLTGAYKGTKKIRERRAAETKKKDTDKPEKKDTDKKEPKEADKGEEKTDKLKDKAAHVIKRAQTKQTHVKVASLIKSAITELTMQRVPGAGGIAQYGYKPGFMQSGGITGALKRNPKAAMLAALAAAIGGGAYASGAFGGKEELPQSKAAHVVKRAHIKAAAKKITGKKTK